MTMMSAPHDEVSAMAPGTDLPPPPPPPPVEALETIEPPPEGTDIAAGVEPGSGAPEVPTLIAEGMVEPDATDETSEADTTVVPARARVARLAEQLTQVPIAYEAPVNASMGEAFEVSLAIDATGMQMAAAALPRRDVVTETQAKVSDRVMATLNGAAFSVTSLSPEVQTLSPLTANTWRWQVIPQSGGTQDLVLEIYAMLEADTLPVRTFRSPVSVEVSPVRQLVAAAEGVNPLIAIVGGIGSLLGGLFGVARFFRKT
jgi:hypothetical protein